MKSPLCSQRFFISTAAALAFGFFVCLGSIDAATVINYGTPAADTWVSNASGQGGLNYGTEETWRTRYYANNSSNRKGYVRFNLNSLLTESVQSATLSFTFVNLTNADGTSAPIEIYGLNYNYVPAEGKLGLDWSETALTSDNAPWAASGSGTVPAYVTYLGELTLPVDPKASAGTTFSLSTPELAAFLETFRVNNENNVTFIFRSSQGTFFQFASKENTTYDPASLSITVIPEPASSVLLGLGIGLLLFRMKRRGVRV